MLYLEAIKFNHIHGSYDTDAFNIRKNLNEMLPSPEWEQGMNEEMSVAAYAINEISVDPARPVTIRANFRRTDPSVDTVEIRAIGKSPDFDNLLGTIYSTVTFGSNDETGFVSLKLQNPRLRDAGVGIFTVVWLWQFRLPSADQWMSFGTTRHKVYCVLSTPTLPWRLLPLSENNHQIPWSEALEWACRWARGARTLTEAAAEVTRAVYELGPSVMEYDYRHGDSNYSKTGFDLAAFMALLSGEPYSNGRFVNCSDCATFVSTFANLLGCDLSQQQMGYQFAVNPVILIGQYTLQLPNGNKSWDYHEVAWTGACGPDDNVFDGCLQVNANINVAGSPPKPLLPINRRFGTPGSGDYLDLLAPNTPEGRPMCQPQQWTRRHRKFMHQHHNHMLVSDKLLNRLKDAHHYDEWENSNTLDTNLFVWQFVSSDVQILGWKPRKLQRIEVRNTVGALQSIWDDVTGNQGESVLNAEIYECSSRREAQHFLLERMAQMQLSGKLARIKEPPAGDVAFVAPSDDMILFARANLALLISNVGQNTVPVLRIASAFDEQFRSMPATLVSKYATLGIQTFALAAPARLEAALPLTIDIPNPQQEHLWFKFFSGTGEVELINGIPHYKPSREGTNEVKVFAINSAGNASTEKLQFFI